MAVGSAARRREAQALAAVLAGDAVFDVVAREWVREDLARLRVPHRAIRVIVAAKAASAAGLAVGLRRRRLGLLTSACLVLYFVLAVSAHARARDEWWRWVPAVGMLTWCARLLRSFSAAPLPFGLTDEFFFDPLPEEELARWE